MGKRRIWKSVLYQAAATGIGLLVIFPVLYALGTSFMKSTEILSLNPRMLPRRIDFSNYHAVWENTMMLRFIWNSVFVTTITCCLRVVTAALAAYGYACFDFKGKNLFFYLTVGTMLIPGEVTLLTNYETISKLHMINTYQGIIIMFIGSATSVFIMRQYFLGVSASIKEASEMDGCGDIRFFTRILIPISKPILVTVFITAFVEIWNVYLWPMLITNRNEMRTVQVGIAQLNSSEGSAYGVIMAGAVIVLIPSLLVFIIFQKQIINGMVTGSVKG
ncbi:MULTISPECIES: carbohydrate ABC transporter permease [Hungatella]|uniref:Carbohydrate ABC transporter permease n=1 Tax=Hungatella hathewayi TaxID=154046 RepID=A0A3E4U1J6_9FIRM|nr:MULTISPECIES: carbohydrate ABC transporter permease [Hungatella]RGL99991.1 carbohydrate ABC transporter permease [Hungatella hathewayi]RHM72211.1 carbohydrate ABC transporter permease [Hungatella hathewayi]